MRTPASAKPVALYLAGGQTAHSIARALIKQPSVILLDEPTRSLDPASTAGFWNLVRELADQGASVILATHSFQEAVAIGDFECSVALRQVGGLPQDSKCRRRGTALVLFPDHRRTRSHQAVRAEELQII
jgi:ABC-type phosphate transport system ATPase subunit